MISFRAILLSVCAHLAMAAAILYFHVRGEYPRPADNLVIEAPLGEVFVQEELSPGAKIPASGTAPALPGDFPSEVKEPGENDSFADSEAGVPDGEAQPIGKIEPTYPAASRKLGEEGEAVFLLGIDGEGSVSSATLEHSSGHARLDEAARDALLRAQFEPAIAGGQVVLSLKRFRIQFKLEAKKHGNR